MPGCRRAADLLHQPVVPAAGCHGILCAHMPHHELKGRTGIIIESPDQPRIDFKRDIELFQSASTVSKCTLQGSQR